MLSIKAIKSSGATSKYFAEADYYAKEGDNDAAIVSTWAGQGAVALGLNGRVHSEDLKAVLDGKLPNGSQLGRINKDGEVEHQKGWDLTLSAPKSVSVMALVAKDDRLIKAHHEAVAATMGLIEKEFSITRQMEGGKTNHVMTGSLVIAQFTHTTSRALDPQLHTHSLIMNATQKENGSWGSIESRGFYKNSKLLGTVYQNELAMRVKELGYEVEVNAKKGFFEISGVPESVKKTFSKRRTEVEAAIKEHGYNTAKGFDNAAVRSRNTKQRISEAGLQERWTAELANTGMSAESLRATVLRENVGEISGLPAGSVGNRADANTGNNDSMRPDVGAAPADDGMSLGESGARVQGKEKPIAEEIGQGQTASGGLGEAGNKDSEVRAEDGAKTRTLGAGEKLGTQQAGGVARKDDAGVGRNKSFRSAMHDVDFAFRNLAEREAVFTRAMLVDRTLAWGLGRNGIDDVEHAIDALVSSGQLVEAVMEGESALTTKAAIATESKLVKTMVLGKRAVSAIASEKLVAGALSESGLNAGQEAAARLILTTRDRFIGVQGYAGVGKTFMLGKVREVAEAKGFRLRGMAATGAAAEQLQGDSGITSQTTASLLNSLRNGKDDVGRRELWVVDEASLLNSDDTKDLMTFAKDKGARIAFIGDIKQIGAIDWGKPFYQLMKAGMERAEMKEILRQKENPTLLEAVYDSIDKSPDRALNKIKDTVIEIRNTDERIEAIVERYIALSPKDREHMLVLIPDNETRKLVNEKIQEKLVEAGSVSAQRGKFDILVSQGLTDVEKSAARFYVPGSYVQFGNDYKRLGVEKGEYLQVVKSTDEVVHLKRANGDNLEWRPDSVAGGKSGKNAGVETYDKEQRTIGVGDLIRWKKTDREKGLKNGYLGEIKSVDGQQAIISFKNAGEMSIDLKDNKHWDLGYATTIFSAQGATFKNVMINAESWRRNLMNLKTFYVGISRAKESAFVYTDDAKKLGTETKSRLGEKTSAVEGAGINYQSILDDKGLIIDARIKDGLDAVKRIRDKGVDAVKTALRMGMDI